MDRSERLALVVRAYVATARAEEAQKRSDDHKRRLFGDDIVRAHQAVGDLVDAGLIDPETAAARAPLPTWAPRAGTTRADLRQAAQAAREASLAHDAVISASKALNAAWLRTHDRLPD